MSIGTIFTFLAFITSFVFAFKAIPLLIKISGLKGLTDEPDGKRKCHQKAIPVLGGVALFGGFLISYGIWASFYLTEYLPALVASITILFFTGIKDDIYVISWRKKLIFQVIAAIVIVFAGGIKIPGLDGIFGITIFPVYSGELFSVFAIIIAINAYNLIDGIDGLAGMISIIGASVFGLLFLAGGHYSEAILSFSLVGALAGFIWYNFEPAKIFMGDTGSQLLGLIMVVSGFRLVQLNGITSGFMLDAPAVFIFSVMIIPLFDTLRVINIRLSKGLSPMNPGREHMHHNLLDAGLSHSRIVFYLSAFNVIIVFASLYINSWNVHLYFILVLIMAASILPVMSGLKMLNKVILRQQVKPEILINDINDNNLERFITDKRIRARYIALKESSRKKIRHQNREHDYSLAVEKSGTSYNSIKQLAKLNGFPE